MSGRSAGLRPAGRLLVLLAAALASGAAEAQWGPIHGGGEGGPPAPVAAAPAERADASAAAGPRVVPGAFGGWWGLASPTGQGFDGGLDLGLRVAVEPTSWLVLEAWGMGTGRGAGSDVVRSDGLYLTSVLLAGVQLVHGAWAYSVAIGIDATLHSVVHHVSIAEPQDLPATGLRLGPAWDAAMKWRYRALEVRTDLASVWRGGQADLLFTAGLGLCLPSWTG